MQVLGNERVNTFYEAGLRKKDATWKKIGLESGQTERELFAKTKWAERLFCDEKKNGASAQSVSYGRLIVCRDL
jgi:hypothetical protein